MNASLVLLPARIHVARFAGSFACMTCSPGLRPGLLYVARFAGSVASRRWCPAADGRYVRPRAVFNGRLLIPSRFSGSVEGRVYATTWGKIGEGNGEQPEPALFQGPPRAVRAYFEQHVARERWQPAKARRDNELAAGLTARRAGTWFTAENLKNRVRTLLGLFSTVSEPEGPKNLTAYAILKLWDHNDDSKALPAPANRYPLN